jgi:nucleoside-diphosphate-sugar epimerase
LKVVIPGGSGQVGDILARSFHREGHDVVILSRSPGTAPWRYVSWDAKTLGSWVGEIDGADVVINLAGRSVNCRYNARNRREIMASRVDSTRVVGEAIAAASHPPRVWLQASTATIYAHRYDAANDEATDPLADRSRDRRAGEHRRSESSAQRGVHARAPAGVGHLDRLSRDEMDAGDRRANPENGDGADPEEPARGPRPAASGRFFIRIPAVASGGP